jgi:hypothetical protein
MSVGEKCVNYDTGNCVTCGSYSGDLCIKDYPHLIKVSPDDTCCDWTVEDYTFNVDNKGREYKRYGKLLQ